MRGIAASPGRALLALATLTAPACGSEGPGASDSADSNESVMTLTSVSSADQGEATGESDTSESESGPKLDLDGGETEAGTTATDSGGGCSAVIPATVRDFRSSHVDFEVFWGTTAYTGLVLPQLGADGTPDYNPTPTPPPGYNGSPTQITSAESFADWYHDVSDVNLAVEISLPLTETSAGSGVFSYENDFFFPLDGMGFNDETFPDTNLDPHNFHFTTEVHTSFTYEAGQTFAFDGDDDLWLFIDGQLVIDLGGLHPELQASVDLDTLGLTAGQVYTLDLFHAERRHDGSHFRIDTSIGCFAPID